MVAPIMIIGLIANISNGDTDYFGIAQLLLLGIIIYLIRFYIPNLLKSLIKTKKDER